MAFPTSFLEEIKARADMVSIVRGYAEVKNSGSGFVCLCPFHSEKTPSCHIYEDHFHCFGCGAGGDVITFIRLAGRLDYPEAVRFLAERVGLTVPEDGAADEAFQQKSRVLDMNKAAAIFFRDVLLSAQGSGALTYLQNRGLSANTIRKFGLGFAPDGFSALKRHLNDLRYSDEELVTASLISRNNAGKCYDKFRNRVMFPIIDRRGHVIAFGGRVMDASEPKYLNSGETVVFRKREGLFALNFAKNAKTGRLLLCEGYMDVISLHQAGFTDAVATLGTAITAEQARLMRQYADDVIIAYDADGAGQAAAAKAINLLGQAGVNARVLQMRGAKDPDEYVLKYGAAAFEQLITHSGSAISYELNKLRALQDVSAPDGQAVFLKAAVALLAKIDDDVITRPYVADVAKTCGVQSAVVQDAVNDRRRNARKYAQRDINNALIHEAGKSPKERAIRGILAYLLRADYAEKIFKDTSEADITAGFYQNLYSELKKRLFSGETVDDFALGSAFSAVEMGMINAIRTEGALLPYTPERLADYIGILSKQKTRSLADMSPGEIQAELEKNKHSQ